MSSNEINTILMIELLSLEHKPAGYQIEIGITRNVGYAQGTLILDEYTYDQLNSLGPFGRERTRLSLYPKWDPFRNNYYSTLIKMNQTFSETLYFACSEYYVSQLQQLKQQAFSPVLDAAAQVVPMNPSTEPGRQKHKRASKRHGYAALGCTMIICLVCLFILRMDGTLVDSAEALADPEIEARSQEDSAAPYLPLLQTASLQSLQAEPSPEPSEPPEPPEPSEPPEPPKEQVPLYDVFDLDENEFVYSLPKGYVALSFDDGPSKYTQDIVDILVEHKVAATFLFIGNKAANNPEAVRYASQHEMAVGSHSWDHSKLTDNQDGENQSNLAKANRVLEEIIQTPVTVFRPPYGAINDRLAAKVKEQHMKVLLWNRDPEDWNVNSPEEILQYFQSADPSGGVYLLHEKKITVEALPGIIKYLQGKNMKFAVFK